MLADEDEDLIKAWYMFLDFVVSDRSCDWVISLFFFQVIDFYVTLILMQENFPPVTEEGGGDMFFFIAIDSDWLVSDI